MIKRLTVVILLMTFSLSTYAKRDINAWKKEVTLKKQFTVFKQNLNLWQGFMSFKEPQIDQLFSAVNDTISGLEAKIEGDKKKIETLNSSISTLNANLQETQSKLDESLTRQDSFSTFGIQISKSSFATIMYSVSILLLILAGVLFFLYNQSHQITKEAKEKFEDLYDEFEEYKKNNLERVTKLNRELHDCRMKSGTL
jgi:peptidoglycan hydrolase CwlO-like protein